jgi:hypothetical protein
MEELVVKERLENILKEEVMGYLRLNYCGRM